MLKQLSLITGRTAMPYPITLYMLKKTDNAGLLVPPGGSGLRIGGLLDEEVYEKLLYFLFTVDDVEEGSPIFLNGEIVGYAASSIDAGSPLVYAEIVPSSWDVLWARARGLLEKRDYWEYPFQCISMKRVGDRVACMLPGADRPVFIDYEASRRMLGIDPLEASTPLFIGNITSPPNPSGLSGIYSYTPELIPYLAYLYRIMA